MGEFLKFKKVVQEQMQKILASEYVFRVDINREEIWNIYLNSFPEGANCIYKERREYDCNCCKQFIRNGGDMVTIVDNRLVSIWDISVPHPFADVAVALSRYVKSKPIKNRFFHFERSLGTDFNREILGEEVVRWEHFYCKLPLSFVITKDSMGSGLNALRGNKDVLKRGMEEISISAIETVLELIEQKSIYRGEEHKALVKSFLELKKKFDKIGNEKERDNFCWVNGVKSAAVARIKNSVIGTLLLDISIGEDLDTAVNKFEAKVAPANYKRSSAVITKRMITKAQKRIEDLGLGESLSRRYATKEDISINNVLFVSRSTKRAINVFDEMRSEAKESIKNLKKVEEVSLDTFINDIVPKASAVELFFENRHTGNLVSVVAPIYGDSKPMFKWGNKLSWSYNGEMADSVKERVKRSGGNINGVLRCSLSWFNYDDLDIHAIEPDKNLIYYGNRRSLHTTGQLDVDMNAGGGNTRDAVENITWLNKDKMLEGEYKILVHNYRARETADVGFVVEIEYEGALYTFTYDKKVPNDKKVLVATFNFSLEKGLEFIRTIPRETPSKKIWGIATQKYHNVEMILDSPNYWDDSAAGNKHCFFILDNCINEGVARGYYNEFLKEALMEERKVFEVLASKMKVAPSINQLSGVGFSLTQRNHFYCRVKGAFSRTIKITI